MRAYNDLDHFAPVIAEFIKRNENPLIIFTSDLDFKNDYRIVYLKTLGDFEVFRDIDFAFIRAGQRDTLISKILARLFAIVCKSKIKKLFEQRIVSS